MGGVLSLLWGVYRLLGMPALTHHRLNRLTLVAILLLSLALPALALVHAAHSPSPQVVAMVVTDTVAMPADPAAADATTGTELLPTLAVVYMAGLSAATLWLLCGLVAVAVSIGRGRRISLDGRVTLVLHRRHTAPFTWGRWIVMSEADYRANADTLLAHELAHLRAAHWADLLLARVTACICWYWPTAWWFTRDLASVHEYQADSAVLSHGALPAYYQMLLISMGAPAVCSNIVNPFNYSSLKKRITMMQKQKSSSASRLRALAMLPAVAAITVVALSPAAASALGTVVPSTPSLAPVAVSAVSSTPEIKDSSSTPTVEFRFRHTDRHTDSDSMQPLLVVDGAICPMAKLNDLHPDSISSITVLKDNASASAYGEAGRNGVLVVQTKSHAPQEGKAYNNVEEMPSFPGGETEMFKFLSQNLRYPEAAAAQNKQGRVTVSFRVEKDGSVTSAKVVRGICPELDAEALRVVGTMPKFNPGRMNGEPVAVWYTLPITFRLAPDKAEKKAE